jgi:hypothetical protein
MPYRRLPNTDKSRLKAIKTALEKGKELPPFKLAYSQNSLFKLQSFISSFEQALSMQKQNYQHLLDNNQQFREAQKKARLYISHFIQVMNMAIIRGELPSRIKSYYGLDNNLKSVPSLKSDEEMLEIGRKLIDGETQRCKEGVSGVTNPTLAVVKVWFDKYVDAYMHRNTLQKRYHASLEKITEIREQADGIILKVWNEVEDHFSEQTDEARRERAAEYGLTYVYRKNELKEREDISEDGMDADRHSFFQIHQKN